MLTAQLTDISTSGIAPDLAGVEDDVPAQAVKALGGLGLDIHQQSVEAEATKEYTELKEEFVAPEALKEKAQALLGKSEEDLVKAKRALDQGVMGESMFKAKADAILKKYIAVAPGLTREFAQIGRSVLGFDPSAAMVSLALQGRRQSGSQQKTEHEQYYQDVYLPVIKQAGIYSAEPRSSFTTINSMQEHMADAIDFTAKKNQVSSLLQKMNLGQQEQDEAARLHSNQTLNDVQIEGLNLLKRLEETGVDEAGKREQLMTFFESRKAQIQTISQEKWPLATNVQKTYAPIIGMIDGYIEKAKGGDIAGIYGNITNYKELRARNEILSRHDNLGYKVVTLLKDFKTDTELTGLLTNLYKETIGVLKKEHVSQEYRNLFGFDKEEQPTAEGKSALTSGWESVKNILKDLPSYKRDPVIEEISSEVLPQMINGYTQSLNSMARKKKAGEEIDSWKHDIIVSKTIQAASQLGFDQLTDVEYTVLQNAVAESYQGAKKLLETTKHGKPLYSLVPDKDGVKLKRNQPPSLGEVMFGTGEKKGSSRGILRAIERDLNALYLFQKDVDGITPEDFINSLTNNEEAKEITEDPIEEKGLTEEEMEVDVPPLLKSIDIEGMKLYQETHGDSPEQYGNLMRDERLKGKDSIILNLWNKAQAE